MITLPLVHAHGVKDHWLKCLTCLESSMKLLSNKFPKDKYLSYKYLNCKYMYLSDLDTSNQITRFVTTRV